MALHWLLPGNSLVCKKVHARPDDLDKVTFTGASTTVHVSQFTWMYVFVPRPISAILSSAEPYMHSAIMEFVMYSDVQIRSEVDPERNPNPL